MPRKLRSFWAPVFVVMMLASVSVRSQDFDGSVSGYVTDPSGAVVPGATVSLSSVTTGWTAKFTTGKDGHYLFGNLERGVYNLGVAAQGFRDLVQRQVLVNLNESVRVDVKMEVGSAVQSVEVTATNTGINFENGENKGSITPEVIADLPLIVSGNQRSAAAFVVLLPGVNTGGAADPFDSRINGGIQGGDEAVLDGVTMQEGVQSQSGMVAMYNDYPITPESVNEVSVLKSDYEPQYGYTSAAVITAVTKSGTDQFHGTAHELLRNADLNARSFNTPTTPQDSENDWGATIGGPAKIPGLWGGSRKTYFFFAYGGYTSRGGTVSSILSLPTTQEREGNFSDWVDSSGNLIPIYDPATTQANPGYNPNNPVGPGNQPYLRTQFSCGGVANVICPTDPRLTGSLANAWTKYLPKPTFSGIQNNFIGAPLNIGYAPSFNRVSYDARVDEYLGSKDHASVEIHFHQPEALAEDSLPFQLATSSTITHGGYVGPTMDRLNLDHTFSPTMLNNFNIGYSDYRGIGQCLDQPYTGDFPQIGGVANHYAPPQIAFQDYTSFGCNTISEDTKPNMSFNDMMSWVHGRHTLKYGVDMRWFQLNLLSNTCGSGCFNFDRLNTGLAGTPSGDSFASFLLGQVSSANTNIYTVDFPSTRQHSLGLHVGDTWRINPKLSLNYGLRWDMSTPSYENFDRFSFFNPKGVDPGAGGRLGDLAFAGKRWGPASYGARYPEQLWLGAFAPRFGFAYTLNPNMVVRGGYGLFYTQAYYPSWAGGMAEDGFNSSPSVASSEDGLQAAMVLSQGFPGGFPQPPFVDPSFDNGQSGPLYRPFNANRLTYTQQWNLTIERQVKQGLHVSAAYVANKGTRLPSQEVPLNALNPSLLKSMGQELNDTFVPGETSLDGVPVPYAGWTTQLQACSPTVAQALVPYPQYCGSLTGLNENAGNSTYHSLQLQVENRFAHNLYLLGSYTLSKLLTSSDFVTPQAETWSGAEGSISPYERERNKSLSTDNVPQTLSVSLLYKLPFGKGQRFVNGNSWADKIVGGWEATTIFRISDGTPFLFRSSVCNVPNQFDVGCIPGMIKGANPWALGARNFSPNASVFNASAFESANNFNFYYGQGPRVSNLRGPGFHNQDFGLLKDVRLTERLTFQLRGEFFNLWNWHVFNCVDECFGSTAFTTDVGSPNFGRWNGSVTAPRNIQVGAELKF